MLRPKSDVLTGTLTTFFFVSGALAQQEGGAARLIVTPLAGIAASGPQNGMISPSSIQYTLRSSAGTVMYAITSPGWINADPQRGSVGEEGVTVTLSINAAARSMAPGHYGGPIRFTNTTNGRGTTGRAATLTIERKSENVRTLNSSDPLTSDGGHLLDNNHKPLIAR